MRQSLVLVALTASLALGCGAGRSVQKGIDQYDRADYPGASAEFYEMAGDEGSMNNKGLVRFLVYRGLTFYHLGQRPQAYGYLVRGKTAYERGSKSWLKPSILGEMDAALADLARDPVVLAPGASPAPAAPPAAAPGGPQIIIVNPAR